MTKTRNYLYKIILLFAVADLSLGISTMIVENFPLQLSSLIVTTLTLVFSIAFAIKYPRNKRSDIVMVVVGSLDFITTLISVLVFVLATQIIALVASSFTLLKAVKIFVQSEKTRRLLGTTKPILLKIAQRLAPAFGVWLVSKINYLKTKLKGDTVMEKIKQFFVTLGNQIRANKISLGGTVVNGGAWGFLGYLVNELGILPIDVNGFNITPLFSILGFALGEISLFWENYPEFLKRIKPKLDEKAKKAEEKAAAEKEKEAELERARILAAIQAEKDAVEAEKKAAEEKAELEKAEAEAKAKKEEEDKAIAEWLAKQKANEETTQG